MDSRIKFKFFNSYQIWWTIISLKGFNFYLNTVEYLFTSNNWRDPWNDFI